MWFGFAVPTFPAMQRAESRDLLLRIKADVRNQFSERDVAQVCNLCGLREFFPQVLPAEQHQRQGLPLAAQVANLCSSRARRVRAI
jgi:hypothetical protein